MQGVVSQGQSHLLMNAALSFFFFFCLQQASSDAPTTPKYTKEQRDLFFPASLPTPVLVSHSTCHPLSTQDSQAKVVYEPLSKLPRPQTSSFHDQPQHRRGASHSSAAMAFLPQTGTAASSHTHQMLRRPLILQTKINAVFPLNSAALSGAPVSNDTTVSM